MNKAARVTYTAAVFFIYGIFCGLVLLSHWGPVVGLLLVVGGVFMLCVEYLALRDFLGAGGGT